MSRLDYVTIGIVTAIVLILGFLVFKTIDLVNKDNLENNEQTEQTVADLQNNESDYDEDEDYKYDDEGDIVKEDLEEALPSMDIDLDDDELGEDYDEIADEPVVDDYEADKAAEEDDYPSEDATSPTSYDDESDDDASLSSEGAYMVIAGSYKIKANAESAARKLRSQGYNNASVGLFNRGAYANVIVDRFDSSSSASELAKELKAKGIEAYVQKKKGN